MARTTEMKRVKRAEGRVLCQGKAGTRTQQRMAVANYDAAALRHKNFHMAHKELAALGNEAAIAALRRGVVRDAVARIARQDSERRRDLSDGKPYTREQFYPASFHYALITAQVRTAIQ